jgi:hypothetical protein
MEGNKAKDQPDTEIDGTERENSAPPNFAGRQSTLGEERFALLVGGKHAAAERKRHENTEAGNKPNRNGIMEVELAVHREQGRTKAERTDGDCRPEHPDGLPNGVNE